MFSAGLCEQVVAEKPYQLRATLAKALGGVGFEEGLATLADPGRLRAIVATKAALRPLSIAEQLAVHNVAPNSSHITLTARLVRIENNKEVFDADEWLHNLQMVNRYTEEDQREAVLGGLIATMKPYIVAAIDAQGGWGGNFSNFFTPNYPNKLDVALTLLDDTPTAPRWEWINRLWKHTQTSPTVKAAAATLHRHPELIGLVGAVDVDADNDHNHTLVAAGNRAAETLTVGQLYGHNQCRGTEVSTMATKLTLHPNLLTWLLAGEELWICNWARGHFDANQPTCETAKNLAATLDGSYAHMLWDNKNNIAPNICRTLLVNTLGVPHHVWQYGHARGQENIVNDTVDVFGEAFGENVDKWAALDALNGGEDFDRNSSIAQVLAMLD